MRIYGFHPLREALRGRPHLVDLVWIAPGRSGGRRREVEALCRRHSVAMAPAESEDFPGVGEAVHNGFVAEVRGEPAPTGEGDRSFVVLLEDVQDPRNLGAILRVCDGAGVGRVLVRDRGSAPLSPTVAKTSSGALEHLAVERVTNSATAIRELRDGGYWIYGAVAGGRPPWEIDLTGPLAICFGGEERGLRARTRGECDALVGLPMRGRVGALNVATAAAAILYEAVRQRSSGSGGS